MAWIPRPTQGQNAAADAAPEEVRTADEFESADKVDNDVEADEKGRVTMERALERLRGQHLAFRRPERCEECSLEALRLQILTAVTESPELESYYKETWGEGTVATPAAGVPLVWPAERRIAVMQVELMSRAFYVLQLQLFANAPENHGWMTLFRRWGRSPRFNQVFEELEPTLAPAFAKFYRIYLRHLPARASASGHLPVHHPWLKPEDARGRGLYMDSGRMEAEIEVRPGAGGVLDHRGSESADQTFETPSDAPDRGSEPSSGTNE